ncbi:MAG: hypothetical protein AAGP08_08815 [Pseudomonadota bacterium]
MLKLNMTWAQNVLLAYICLWATAPPLAYGGLFRLAVLAAAAGWLAIESVRPGSILRRPTLPVLLVFAYVLYVAFVEGLFHGASGIIRNLQIFIALFFLVVHQSRRHTLEVLAPVFWIILLTLPIWYALSLNVLLTENSHAARILVRSGAEARALSERGVGGYALVYTAVLATPALLSLAFNTNASLRDGLPRLIRAIPAAPMIIIWANILLGSLFALNAGFSIAVILLFLGCFATLAMRSYNPMKLVLFVLAAIVFALFAKDVLELVLNALLPLTEGSNFNLKIRDVLASLQAEEALGTLSDRTERYERSFFLFLQSPLIGVLSFNEIGKHSQFLDEFAQFGIIVGAMFMYVMLFLPAKILRTSTRQHGAALGTFVATGLLFSLNNGFVGAGVALFIMFPVAIHFADQQRAYRFGAMGVVRA